MEWIWYEKNMDLKFELGFSSQQMKDFSLHCLLRLAFNHMDVSDYSPVGKVTKL